MDWLSLKVLFLIVVANSVPVMLRNLLGDKFKTPLDGGVNWTDGRPLLGNSKTVRGLLAAVIITAMVAYVIGFEILFGAVLGLLTMCGDLISSFIKRRSGLAPSSRSLGLDQIPEALLPATFAYFYLQLTLADLVFVVVLFFVFAVGFSPLLFRLGLRRRPY
jgi:CDP-2,3-bis-(O-geranylgeranyl)-sn-glycerol synthase